MADTPETQGSINVLLARVIEELSAYGLDEREREAAIEEHFSGKSRGCVVSDKPLAERIKEEIVAMGYPVPEDDPVHDEYWYRMIGAIKGYELYTRTRERRKILAGVDTAVGVRNADRPMVRRDNQPRRDNQHA